MPQIERMLGHRKESMSDIYALAHPGQLGAALEEIEAVIDEIEKLAPGAFSVLTPEQRAASECVSGQS